MNMFTERTIDMVGDTTNKVRNTIYQFRLYKINEDNTTPYQLFPSLEEYKYFKPTTLVEKITTNSFYLDKQKQKIK